MSRRARKAAQADYVAGFFREYIRALRAVLKRRGLAAARGQRPCSTCAFNPSTDRWPGFQTTMLGLLQAIEAGRPFYCHKGLPRDAKTRQWYWDPRKPKPAECAGWRAIADDPATQRAAVVALQRAGKPPFLRRRAPGTGGGMPRRI